MKLAVIGYGNAGGKIADQLLAFEQDTGRSLIGSILAVNTARVDLARLDRIPEQHRVLIGQTDERVKGHGVGGDPDLGAAVTEKDRHELDRALDDVPVYDIDGFLVVAGLAGGTGSGGAPKFAEYLHETYDEPVYGLGILPAGEEGGRASLNAARSLRSLSEATTNLLLFDNAAWRGGTDSVEGGYQRTNQEIARRLVTLLSAGEIDGSTVSENAMDASDIRRTLATGGVSTIAYAESGLQDTTVRDRGLLSRFRSEPETTENGADAATKVSGLVRQAVQSRLTCPAEVDSVERSLIIVSGPPAEFSRKGLESARRWLERRTGSAEVLAGDDPRPGADTLSAAVLLSNPTEVPRIERLQERGVEAKENIEAHRAEREQEIEALVTDEMEELDPV